MRFLFIALLLAANIEASAIPNHYKASKTKTTVYKPVKSVKPITAKKVNQGKAEIKLRGVKVKITVKF